MSFAVIGNDRGRFAVKGHLIVNGQEFAYLTPSVVVPEPPGADPDGDPLERIVYRGTAYLVGNRALTSSPDAIFRTTGSKTQGQAALEFQVSFCALLAWAATKAPIQDMPVLVVTSAPDSEYDTALPGLKEILTDSFRFFDGAGRFYQVDVPAHRVLVARESMAPFWGQTMTPEGGYRTPESNPLMWTVGGRPGHEEAIHARALSMGMGFRDSFVAITEGGRRLESRSIMRGVSEIYAALWDTVTGPEIRFPLKHRADVDKILTGRHPIWSHRDAAMLEQTLQRVIKQKGSALLSEALQWAGDGESYHTILATGGGSLLLRELVTAAFPKALFAAQGDSARGLAYAGVKSLRPKSGN